jgi:hypothetical protein
VTGVIRFLANENVPAAIVADFPTHVRTPATAEQ